MLFASTVFHCSVLLRTSSWSSGKCVRFGAGRSKVRLLAGSYQDLVNWYCSLITRRTVCGRAAGNSPRTQNNPSENEPSNCTISVLALQDHCSYKAPTTNHHIKQSFCWVALEPRSLCSTCVVTYLFNFVCYLGMVSFKVCLSRISGLLCWIKIITVIFYQINKFFVIIFFHHWQNGCAGQMKWLRGSHLARGA